MHDPNTTMAEKLIRALQAEPGVTAKLWESRDGNKCRIYLRYNGKDLGFLESSTGLPCSTKWIGRNTTKTVMIKACMDLVGAEWTKW